MEKAPGYKKPEHLIFGNMQKAVLDPDKQIAWLFLVK